jgi:hypothetical protein
MLRKGLVAVVASVFMVTAFAALPADARAKKKAPYRPEAPYRSGATTSLDGRVTGRPRTCGYATFQYDGFGVPYGPYCH